MTAGAALRLIRPTIENALFRVWHSAKKLAYTICEGELFYL